MCDPTVLTIASTVVGLAGTAADYIGQSDAASQQEEAYNQWAAQQSKNRAEANAKDQADRQMADAARAQGLQDVSAANQKTEQQQEQDRLTSYLQGSQDSPASTESGAAPVSVADARLSGQQAGDSIFQEDLASKLNTAAQDSKKRIAALATVGSYGGSYGGLDTSNAEAFQRAGEGIDLGNEFRKGDLSVYQIQQAVDPLQYSYTKSPISGIASQALSIGGQGLGKMLAGSVKV
jgi:hypothetical protein